MSQDSVGDLEVGAGENQLVHEVASLEDSCVDASVVLQDPDFVP